MSATGPGEASGRRGARRARQVRRGPIVVAVVALLAGAVAVEVVDPGDADEPRGAASAVGAGIDADTVIPSGDALSTTWYCAEGTTAPDGRAPETVFVANLGGRRARAVVTVMPGDADPQQRRVEVPAGERVAVDVADVLAAPEALQTGGALRGPGVVVEVFGSPGIVEHSVRDETSGDEGMGPCARRAGTQWYFGGGTTVRGAEQYLSLFNPFGDDAVVDVTFLTDGGVQTPDGVQGLVVPRRTRLAVLVHEQVRRQERVATVVEARTGRVVAEQSLRFDGSDGPAGIALAPGAPRLSEEWWLPFGTTGGDGSALVMIANFATRGAPLAVRASTGDPANDPPADELEVPGRAVSAIPVGQSAPAATELGVSVRGRGDAGAREPVAVVAIATSAAGVVTDAGVARPARRWAFAGTLPLADADATAGAAAAPAEVDTAISVLYPRGSGPVTVRLRAAPPGGGRPVEVASREVARGARLTLSLDELELGADQVLVLEATGPVVAERVVVAPSRRSLGAGVPAAR